MNTKLTNILLIILLIFNGAFLTTWWIGRHRFHHPRKEARLETTFILNNPDKGEMFLVKTLGLDSLQQKKLDKVMETHFNFLDKYVSACIRNQSALFNAVKDGKDSVALRCADSLGVLKVIMEKELYTHFSSIKNICNSGQQEQLDELIDDLSREFIHRHNFHNTEKSNHDSL